MADNRTKKGIFGQMRARGSLFLCLMMAEKSGLDRCATLRMIDEGGHNTPMRRSAIRVCVWAACIEFSTVSGICQPTVQALLI
jgi:hypothetical protein